MNTQDVKNNILYSRIVKEAFGFTRESYKLFKHRLFFERDIAPEYKKLLGESKDLRARYDIPNEFSKDSRLSAIAERSDKGWKIFNKIFYAASINYDITYQNFYSNKKLIDSNEMKIPKLFKKYYTRDKEKTASLVNRLKNLFTRGDLTDSIKKRILNSFLTVSNINVGQEEKNLINFFAYDENEVQLIFEFMAEENERVKKKVEYQVILDKEQQAILVNNIVDIANEVIGMYKTPRKNLQLVISLNPVDWFLCSSGEEWSSCLNLNNSGEVFWHGLPSLIGDKSRAMAYITDGKKKVFEGIEVDRIISRSWIILLRTKEDNKTHFHFVREYPNSIGLKDMLKNATGFDFKDIEFFEENYKLKKVVSRYYVETLLDVERVYSTIYMDTTKIKVAKKNKAKYNFGEYCYYKLSGSGYASFKLKLDGKSIAGVEYEDEMPSLRDLLYNGEEIQNYLVS